MGTRVPSFRVWPRIAVTVCAAVAALSCERALGPRRTRLSDLRQHATGGLGTFYGRVLALDPSRPCWQATQPVAGITVEVGLWDGSPAFYRDTVTHEPPSRFDDPRFLVITSAVSDHEGRFQVVDLPRGLGYAFRAIPPRSSPWKGAYGVSMFGIPNGADLRDFPRLCVSQP
jgi:hypothetical protein